MAPEKLGNVYLRNDTLCVAVACGSCSHQAVYGRMSHAVALPCLGCVRCRSTAAGPVRVRLDRGSGDEIVEKRVNSRACRRKRHSTSFSVSADPWRSCASCYSALAPASCSAVQRWRRQLPVCGRFQLDAVQPGAPAREWLLFFCDRSTLQFFECERGRMFHKTANSLLCHWPSPDANAGRCGFCRTCVSGEFSRTVYL